MNGRGHWLAQLAVLSSLAVPSVALAQAPATSFDELTRWVRIGDRVTVTDVTGHKVTGNIAGLKPETLALAVGEALRDFAQADTATITRREPDTLSNGALIGASVGAGLFLLALASSGGCDGCGGFVVLAAAFYGGARRRHRGRDRRARARPTDGDVSASRGSCEGRILASPFPRPPGDGPVDRLLNLQYVRHRARPVA